jgi:hypothetical protein
MRITEADCGLGLFLVSGGRVHLSSAISVLPATGFLAPEIFDSEIRSWIEIFD